MGEKSVPAAVRRSVQTASGEISYLEQGSGPVTLFVHGELANSHIWRHQLSGLSGARLFFPEERPAQFNREAPAHWTDS